MQSGRGRSLARVGRASHLRGAWPRGRGFSSHAADLSWKEARFGGATIEIEHGRLPGTRVLQGRLGEIMAEIRAAERRGVFMKVPMHQAEIIPLAADHGFEFHHADGDHAMLLAWLPSTSSPVPDFATHVIGVGGMALNDRFEVLAVKEKRAPAATSQGSWKLPGGLLDLGEDIADGVAREVKEETGVVATFRSILAARHQHGAAFGRSDLYIACLLNAETYEIHMDEEEIGECRWLPLAEYYEGCKATSKRQGIDENFNTFVARNVLAACERGEDLEKLGTGGKKMQSPKGYVPGVTGLTSKPEFWVFSNFS
jgi:ADP-ribose pyrophosphatase YjhB (NUDIX family)